MIKISIVTDELSADPESAIELATDWGIHDFELRGYFTERVPQLTAYQVRHLGLILDDYGARVVALSPGLFKMPYPADKPVRWSFTSLDLGAYEGWESARRLVRTHMLEILPKTLDLANALGARTVVCFGFHRAGSEPGSPPASVIDILGEAAEKAASAGIVLAMETEDGYWADTGGRTRQVVERVNHPALRVNWDPGNAFCAGETPFPNGYAALGGLIQHVHFKDARRSPDGSAEFVTRGEIDWQGQIQALIQDGYDGYISIETHLRPKIAEARAAFDRLSRLIQEAHQRKQHSRY